MTGDTLFYAAASAIIIGAGFYAYTKYNTSTGEPLSGVAYDVPSSAAKPGASPAWIPNFLTTSPVTVGMAGSSDCGCF